LEPLVDWLCKDVTAYSSFVLSEEVQSLNVNSFDIFLHMLNMIRSSLKLMLD